MAEQDTNIAGLVRGLLRDTRELIREEIALARAEIREEISAAQTVGIAFGSAALAALLRRVRSHAIWPRPARDGARSSEDHGDIERERGLAAEQVSGEMKQRGDAVPAL